MKEFLASFKSSLPAWSVPLCGVTGAALFLAGIVCFVAYNWADLGTLYKFALPLIGLLACALGAYIKGLESAAGFIQSVLGKKLRTRQFPKLTFLFDESVKESFEMVQKIDRLRNPVAEPQPDSAPADSSADV